MKFFIFSITFIFFMFNLFGQDSEKIKEANKLVNEGELNKAKIILDDLYDKNDEEPEVNYLLAVISLRENNYDDAIDYLDDAIEADENNYKYYNMLGNAYGMKAQSSGIFKAAFAAPKAKSNWEKALELKPDYLNAKQALFQYYLRAPGIMGGDDDKAKEIALDLLKTHSALGHINLATYYLVAEENMEKVDQELQQSINVEPADSMYEQINRGNVNLLNTIGYYFLGKDSTQKSKKFFIQAIDLAPRSANPYDSMGDYYVAVANFDSALICYEKALEQNPKFYASKINKGKMLEKLNRKNEAILVYKELVKESPDNRFGEEAEDRLDELE